MDRRPRLSSAQWEQLVGFFEQNPQAARGYARSTQARQQALRMWEQLAALLNAEGEGVTKEAKSWSKFWNDYKCKLKKKVHDIRVNMAGTGGGPALEEVLSNIEIRLLAVLGENFGGQLEGVAVEPFALGNQVPLQVPALRPDQGMAREELESPSPERAHPPADQPPADQPPPSAQRVMRRGPLRQRRTRLRNRPQTAFDEAHRILADIEAKRVEAELLNATSIAEMVKLLARKISVDERAVAVQEELGRQMTSAINSLAESVRSLTKRGHEHAKDA